MPEAVLSGDIVPQADSQRSERERRRQYTASVDEDTVEKIIRERVMGLSLRALSEKYGVSHETVRRWCGEALAKREQTPRDIPGIRARILLEMETAQARLWKLYREGDLSRDPRVMLDALSQIRMNAQAQAQLTGANMPVRHDVTVTEQSRAEQELQEMINEAKAQMVNEEEAVIRAASEDPEL